MPPLARSMVTAHSGGTDIVPAEFIKAALHLAGGALLAQALQDKLGRIAAEQQVADLLLLIGRVVDMSGVKAHVQQGALERPGLQDGAVIVVVEEGHHPDAGHKITS